MYPRLPTGHWLDSVELSLDKLLSFVKSTLPRDVPHPERLQEVIALLETSRQLVAREAEEYRQRRLNIPKGYCKLPSPQESKTSRSIADLISIGIVGIAVLLFISLYHEQHGSVLQRLAESWGISLSGELFVFLGLTVAVIFGVIYLHEGNHGIAIWGLTGRWPRFVRQAGVIGPTFDAALPRWSYFLVLIAPLVSITGLGLGLMLILPAEYALFALIALIFNTLASIADLQTLWQLLRADPRALGTAWGIYAPARSNGETNDGPP